MVEAGQQETQLLWLVRSVGVHLHHCAEALVQGPAEPGDVRCPESLLLGAVQHVDVSVCCRQLIRDRPGAVWTVVVHHKHVGVRH